MTVERCLVRGPSVWHMGGLTLRRRHRQALTHSSGGGDKRAERSAGPAWERVSHLERDPLVLSGLAEGMSQEEDIIHPNAQSQEG